MDYVPYVDYQPFKSNRLIKIIDTSKMDKINNYNMVLCKDNK